MVDIHAPPRKKSIRLMAQYAKDEKERQELLDLTANNEEGKVNHIIFLQY